MQAFIGDFAGKYMPFAINCFYVVFVVSQNGESALHAAALFGHLSVCKQLVSAGADPQLRNHDSCSPIQIAEHHKHAAVVDYLKNCANRTHQK